MKNMDVKMRQNLGIVVELKEEMSIRNIEYVLTHQIRPELL